MSRSIATLIAAATLGHFAVTVEVGFSSASAAAPALSSKPQLISTSGRLPTAANAPFNKPPLTWENTLMSALMLSKNQNGGTAKVSTSCFPEQRLCSYAVLFKMRDGMDAVIRFTKDMSGQLVQKEFCDFDKFGDTRTCIDWDTAETHREWRNSQGDWIKVGDQ